MGGEMKNKHGKISNMEVTDEMVSNPEMDRKLRESLKEEADKIAEELENNPELQDIKAPDDMYDKIVEKLKDQGIWEEPSQTDVYELLSEKDREALKMGQKMQVKRAKREKCRKKLGRIGRSKASMTVLIIVASLLAVGCGSEASRAYVQRMLSLVSGGQLSITLSGDENNIRNLSVEEEKIYKNIKDALGVAPIDWTYSPDSMVLEEYQIEDTTHSCIVFYEINGKPMTVQIYKNVQEDSKVAKYDGEIIKTTRIKSANLEVPIWQINNWKETKAYVVQFEYANGFYIITGEIDDENFTKLIQSINFYEIDTNA